MFVCNETYVDWKVRTSAFISYGFRWWQWILLFMILVRKLCFDFWRWVSFLQYKLVNNLDAKGTKWSGLQIIVCLMWTAGRQILVYYLSMDFFRVSVIQTARWHFLKNMWPKVGCYPHGGAMNCHPYFFESITLGPSGLDFFRSFTVWTRSSKMKSSDWALQRHKANFALHARGQCHFG